MFNAIRRFVSIASTVTTASPISLKRLVFSSNSEFFVSASRSNQIALWYIKEPSLNRALGSHPSVVTDLKISANSQYVLSSSIDGSVKLFNTAIKNSNSEDTLKFDDSVLYANFCLQDRKIVIATRDKIKSISICTASDVNNVFMDCYPDSVTLTDHHIVNHCEFSSYASLFATACVDGTVKLWHMDSIKLLATFKHSDYTVKSCRFLPGNRYILSLSFDNTLKIYDYQRLRCVAILKGHETEITQYDCSVSGHFVISRSNKQLLLWDLHGVDEGQEVFITPTIISKKSVKFCKFSFDENHIIYGINSLYLYNIKTKKIVAAFSGHRKNVIDCAFSPDGKILVSAALDETLKFWDIGYLRLTPYIIPSIHFFASGVKQSTTIMNDRLVVEKTQNVSDFQQNQFGDTVAQIYDEEEAEKEKTKQKEQIIETFFIVYNESIYHVVNRFLSRVVNIARIFLLFPPNTLPEIFVGYINMTLVCSLLSQKVVQYLMDRDQGIRVAKRILNMTLEEFFEKIAIAVSERELHHEFTHTTDSSKAKVKENAILMLKLADEIINEGNIKEAEQLIQEVIDRFIKKKKEDSSILPSLKF